MAKQKGKGKKKKGGLPVEIQEEILGLQPTDLAVETSIEENAIEILKAERKEELSTLTEQIREWDKALNDTKEVADALEKLAEAKANNMDPDHIKAKEDAAALKAGYANDLKMRGAKVKFMKKTLKHHIESGALKRKA